MPINKKSKVNRIITWLHLWLGLISGIIVVIVSITGCLFVFQSEISDAVYKKEFFVSPPTSSVQRLPLHVLNENAEKALGKGHPANYITVYADPHRAWEFMAYEPGNEKALTFAGSINFYQSAFINPYTGEITGRINYMNNFFVLVKYLHWSLLLNTPYGQPIVGWATVLFVISLITGLIMWVPSRWNKIERNKSFKIKWNAAWKRLNYDLHNVLGFYTFLIALILAFTGMVYSFTWFSKAVYAAGSLSTKPLEYPTFLSDTTASNSMSNPLDMTLAATRKMYPNAKRYGVGMPVTDQDPISCTGYFKKEVYYDANTLYFDQYSGKQLGSETFAGMNTGEKLIAMNYDIHVGAIGGLPGKIIAFLVSLVCASLPITGFVIWWGKKNKKTPPTKQKSIKKMAAMT